EVFRGEGIKCGSMSTVLLHLDKVLNPKLVDSPAVWFRHHHPQVEVVQMGAVGAKTDDDAPRLRAILLERRGYQRVLSLADPQFHAAAVLRLALGAEFREPALGFELQLHPDLVGAA